MRGGPEHDTLKARIRRVVHPVVGYNKIDYCSIDKFVFYYELFFIKLL